MPLFSNLLRKENSYIKENQIPFFFCCLASALAIISLFFIPNDLEETFWKITGALYSFLPTTFILERIKRNQNTLSRRSIQIAVGLLILLQVFVCITIFRLHEDTFSAFIQIIALQLLLHLIIAYFPYWMTQNQISLWNSNTRMFLRFILSQVYAAVLQGALSVALVAIIELFNLSWGQVDDELFGLIAILSYGVLAPFVFLSGNPLRIEEESEFEYHKILHNFFHYLIRPILWLYFGILYFYIGFNWMSGSLPSGILPYLILTVSGILFFYFTMRKPYSQSRKAEIIYSALLIPLLFTLFYAVIVRISDYGITVPRYFVLAIAIVVLFNILFSILKEFSIPILISTLVIGISLASFGPSSAIQVSIYSQKQKLLTLISEHVGKELQDIRKEDLEAIPEEISGDEDLSLRKSLKSTFRYLEDFNVMEEILFINPDLTAELLALDWEQDYYNSKINAFNRLFHLDNTYQYNTSKYQYLESSNYTSFQVGNSMVYEFNEYFGDYNKGTVSIELRSGTSVDLTVDLLHQTIQLTDEKEEVSLVSISDLLDTFIHSDTSTKQLSKDEQTIQINDLYQVVIKQLNWSRTRTKEFQLDRFTGYFIINQE